MKFSQLSKSVIFGALVIIITACVSNPSGRRPIVTAFNGHSVTILYPSFLQYVHPLDVELVKDKADETCQRNDAQTHGVFESQEYLQPDYETEFEGKMRYLFLCLKK